MMEVKCKCGKGLGFKRHDEHVHHKIQLIKCKDCEGNINEAKEE